MHDKKSKAGEEMKASYRVLIVEDEGLIARDIANRVESLGHEVVAVAETGQEAIEKAAMADIILMDIRLDGAIDGIEAAARIRARHHVPFIFLTAHTDRVTLDRAKLTGPVAYLVKPLAQSALQTAIEIGIYKHRMERELEEREAWLNAVLNSISDAVVATDANGFVRVLNPAAASMTGWTQDSAEGQPASAVVALVDGATGESAIDPIPLAVLRDASVPVGGAGSARLAAPDAIVQLVSCSGHRITVEGSASPVRVSNEVIGVVLTLRDVSARRWEEQQIRQAQKMEIAARLAASVSAEYSHLLSIISSQSEQLLRQFADYRALRGPLEEIRQAASAAQQINERLSGLRAGETRRKEVLSLNGVIRRTSKMVESVAGDRVRVAIRLDHGLGKVLGNASQLEQMVMNLAVHACEAMPDGGTLNIETSDALPPKGEGFLRMTLTYKGAAGEDAPPNPEGQTQIVDIGGNSLEPQVMMPQFLERMFEPDTSLLEGLGLTDALNIVRAHEGYLTAEAQPSGAIRFEVLLPKWLEPAVPAVLEAPPAQAGLLLVDPREQVRTQLHNFFESKGLNLLEAADVTEAIALGQMHEGELRLVIAPRSQADEILSALGDIHPALKALNVVTQDERSVDEIRAPFTQAALFEKVQACLTSQLDERSNAVSTA
jgi:two-component system cell cycle sensor histidine kinase/response regulator CckA